MEEELMVVAEHLNEVSSVLSLVLSIVAAGFCVVVIQWFALKYIAGDKEALPKAIVRVIVGLSVIILAGTIVGIIRFTVGVIPAFEPMGF